MLYNESLKVDAVCVLNNTYMAPEYIFYKKDNIKKTADVVIEGL